MFNNLFIQINVNTKIRIIQRTYTSPRALARANIRMNEYKIQLENLEDLNYLRDELNKFGTNDISSISELTKQKVKFNE